MTFEDAYIAMDMQHNNYYMQTYRYSQVASVFIVRLLYIQCHVVVFALHSESILKVRMNITVQ